MKINKDILPTVLFPALVFLFYFVVPWLTNHTFFMYRWDEATYYYIHTKIEETGYIPDTLNYIGGMRNYIYPLIYILINNLLLLAGYTPDLALFSIVFQLIIFLSLCISTYLFYLIGLQTLKDRQAAIYSGLFFLILPVISYRLFYSHATFYANFLGISFILLFIYYLLKYRESNNKTELLLSIFFYSVTLFTHQLVFMMATVILGIEYITRLRFSIKVILLNSFKGACYVGTAIVINTGYIIRTPMLQKILSILGVAHYEEFGTEMTVKGGADNLPTLIPSLFIIIAFLSQLILYKKYKKINFFFLFFCFVYVSLLLTKIGIYLPASFRYDTFYIISLPFLVSIFLIHCLQNKRLKILFLAMMILFFVFNIVNIKNGFYLEELTSVQKGLNTLNCTNTVSYFRLAPWIPVLSKSNIYYAHVDIYNAHQDKMEESMIMFSSKEELATRLELMKQKGVDCLVYEKNILQVDGIRVKGWEPWRWEDLYKVNPRIYEDNNVIVFKIDNYLLSSNN